MYIICLFIVIIFYFILTFDSLLLPDMGSCSVQENAESQKGFSGMCLTLAYL